MFIFDRKLMLTRKLLNLYKIQKKKKDGYKKNIINKMRLYRNLALIMKLRIMYLKRKNLILIF